MYIYIYIVFCRYGKHFVKRSALKLKWKKKELLARMKISGEACR